MTEESISQECRLKKTDKTRNCFIDEIKHNEMISKKQKRVSKIINYTEHLLILASRVTGPSANETSWRRRNDISLYVSVTLQVLLK